MDIGTSATLMQNIIFHSGNTFHKNNTTKIRQLIKNHFFLYNTQAGRRGVVYRDASEYVS
jgi:hypothetical protein